MYNGETNILQENLDNFLSLAQRLKILGLLQNGDPQEDLEAEQKAKYEETLPVYNSQGSNKMTAADYSNNGDLRNLERKVSLINGDQQEIDRKVDEHIETCKDGSLKCSFCGKVDNGNNRKQNMRSHVETHLEGISYQCQFCEMTFRSRNPYRIHRSRSHK